MRNCLFKSSFCAFVCLAAAIGCTGRPTESTGASGPERSISVDSPIRVTATVGMVADVVKNVGGDRVSVAQICGSGVDPHLYKVTRDDVQSLRQADMVFYAGLMLEGKMSDALVKEARSRPVIAVTEALDESVLLEPEDFAGHFDPHVWMDVSAWSKCVDVIADELTKFDPAGETQYRENAKRYRDALAKLHEYGLQAIGTIPQESRILVTSHDAFNYFGRAYGLDVQGVQGISTESEAGLQRINDLVTLLVEKKVKSVFIESSVSSDNIEALVEGAKSQGHDVRIGEKELFSDAMGESGTYEGTYIGMLDHNITVVVRGLGGEAPELGLNNKLSK
ncbi:MAG: zinc ABC transporter substrate-binding protein [Pirellulaceae bacterium]